LINELDIDNSISNPTYTPTTLTKEEIRTIIGLCYIPFDFQPKKNWIYRHFTGLINYTSVLTVKCFNAIAGGEGPRLYVLLQIFRVLQNTHLIYTTPCVASVTVILKSIFDH
jgi:hypothetical protein